MPEGEQRDRERYRREKRMIAINDTMEALRRLWITHPDLRLGQILVNYVFPETRAIAMNDLARPPRDTYYYTDQEVLFAIVEALRAAPKSKPVGWCDKE
jgi:hypothetical protein